MITITEKKMEGFVEKNILSKFGIPQVLVSHNGRKFDTPVFRQFLPIIILLSSILRLMDK